MNIKPLFPIALLFVLGTFSSCDLFDKVDDVTFNAELPLEFVVNDTRVNNGTNAVSYEITKTLDATSDADVAKHTSKIKEIKVNKITYSISDVSKSGVTFNEGKLIIVSSGKEIASAGDVSISAVSNIELTSDAAGFNELASKLLADNKEEIKLQGSFTSTPIAFKLSCKIYVTITANAL